MKKQTSTAIWTIRTAPWLSWVCGAMSRAPASKIQQSRTLNGFFLHTPLGCGAVWIAHDRRMGSENAAWFS